MSKVLIVLVYYDRPRLVRGALESILRQGDAPYKLVVIDDGSPNPVRPIVEEMFEGKMDRVEIIRCEDTVEMKKAQGGSQHGELVNKAMEAATDCESVIVLCDDDALVDGYVQGLADFYDRNPTVQWSYCHVVVYDPSKEKLDWNKRTPAAWYNRTKSLIHPACQLDSSQVTWRRTCITPTLRYNSPMTAALDAALFTNMSAKHGMCAFNGLVGQLKGVFADQMGSRPMEARYTPRVQ